MKLLYIFSKPIGLAHIKNDPSAIYFGYGYPDFLKDEEFQIAVELLTNKNWGYYLWYPFHFLLYKLTDVGFALDRIVSKLSTINSFDAVLAVNDSIGLPLALLKAFGIIKPKIYFISAGLINNLENIKKRFLLRPVYYFYRYILKKADGVFLWSPLEMEIYEKIIGGNCYFLPLEIDLTFWQPNKEIKKKDFILSVGRDIGRDFKIIIQAARNLKLPIKIITSKTLSTPVSDDPNVEIINDMIPYERLKQYYNEARIVIVGIKNIRRVSGQSSLIEAMSMGKAIILAKTEALLSVYDLKNEGEVIFYEPENMKYLEQKLHKVYNDSELIQILEKNSLEYIKNHSTSKGPVIYQSIKKILLPVKPR